MNFELPNWVRDAVFYQIFPDRFAKSERVERKGLHLEPWHTPPTSFGFKGGDLYGVVEHLDHLQELGINALYLTPIFASASNHRYHTYDYYNVDPLLGGNEALRTLLDECHARGMRVVLDGVFNHASRGFWQFHQTLENGAGSPYVDWFHFKEAALQGREPFSPYPTDEQYARMKAGETSQEVIGYNGWYNLPALPKFNTDTPAVREFLWGVAEHWMRFGIDGWRLDVAAEIDDDEFWREFRRRVRAINPQAYIVAEIWVESQRWLKGDQFDAVMNYPLTAAAMGFFGRSLSQEVFQTGEYHRYLKKLDSEEFSARLKYLLGLYDAEVNAALLNLLDSHDTPRFITTVGDDESAFEMAQLFLLTFPGAPCIYYGDEIGMKGASDPDCRRTFNWDSTSWDHLRLARVKAMVALRHQWAALHGGEVKILYAADGFFAFERRLGEERLWIAFNINEDERGFNAGEALGADLLYGTAGVQVENKQVRLTLPARSGVVFVVKSA